MLPLGATVTSSAFRSFFCPGQRTLFRLLRFCSPPPPISWVVGLVYLLLLQTFLSKNYLFAFLLSVFPTWAFTLIHSLSWFNSLILEKSLTKNGSGLMWSVRCRRGRRGRAPAGRVGRAAHLAGKHVPRLCFLDRVYVLTFSFIWRNVFSLFKQNIFF